MPDANLSIILKLLDKASEGIKKATKEVKAQQEDLTKANDEATKSDKKKGEEAEKTGKKQKGALLQARDAVKDFRKEMFILGLALGVVTAATAAWAEKNDTAKIALGQIGLAIQNMAAKAGEFFSFITLPLGQLAEKFNTAVGDGFRASIVKAKVEMESFNNAIKDQQILFLGLGQTASDYFKNILDLQYNYKFVNQQAIQQLNELATLTTQVSNQNLLEAQRRTSEQINLLQEYKTNYMAAHAGMAAFTATISQSIRQNMTSALTSIITGAQTAKEAFTQLGKAMIQTIVEFLVQKLVAFALEKTILAGTVAAAVAAGSAVAAAWQPAAVFASVATFGAAGAAGAAGLGLAAATAAGIRVSSQMIGNGKILADSADTASRFHSGGVIRAHNGLAVDEVPIIAQTGEGVLSRRGMTALGGAPALNRLNQGASSGGGGEITVNVYYPKMTSQDEVKALANALGLEIEKQLRYING